MSKKLKKPAAKEAKPSGVRPRTPLIRRAWLSETAERKMVRSRKMFLESLRARIAQVPLPETTGARLAAMDRYRDSVLRVVDRALARYREAS